MRKGLLLLFISASAFAQVYEAKNCVYREGDDPRWAQPDYDDNGWQTTPPDPLRDIARSPYLWERCRIQTPGLTPSIRLYLQINLPSAWILYVEGSRAGSFGDPETGRFTLDTMRELPLPEGAQKPREIKTALRFTRRYANLRTSWPGLTAGAKTDLELRAARSRIQEVSAYLPALAPAVANLGIGVVLLILSMSVSSRRDAVLLGTLSLSQTAITICGGIITARAPVSADLVLPFSIYSGQSGL